MDFTKKHNISVMITEEEIQKRVAEMGAEITKRFEGEAVYLVCILKGSIFFTTELAKNIPLPMEMDFMTVSSYGAARETSGKVTWKTPVPYCEDKRVLVLDDVLDSGITLANVKAELMKLGAAEVATAVMVDKPEGRRVPFEADYVGLVSPNLFLVGYGMDADEVYRNLPYIGAVHD